MVDAREYHERTKHTFATARRATPREFLTEPRSYKAYSDLSRTRLERVRPPQVPALAAVAESAADPRGDTADSGPRAIDLETVATLCYEATGIIKAARVNGITRRFRAASCTGMAYHIDLYPVVGDCEGLPAGVYHFDPRTLDLELLRDGDFRRVLAEAVGPHAAGSAAPGVADAPMTVIATSTWWRNAWKYRERAYRHAFWDTGTIVANLIATAHALQLRGLVAGGFADDRLARLLGIDPRWEAPIAVVPVGSGDPAPQSEPVARIQPETEPVAPDQKHYPLIVDAWRESRLHDGEAVADWRGRANEAIGVGTTEPGSGERVPLVPLEWEAATGRSLARSIRRRRSCRDYETAGPTREQVATVLDRALRGVPADWNLGGADGLAFNDAYVLATDVDGIPDGTYAYYRWARELEYLDDVSRRKKRRLAVAQPWAGDAHVNVYLMADVDAIVERLGNRGYRVAQLEAGVTLGRLYLATYALDGLGGTGLTFFDDQVTEHCRPRGSDQTPTCLFAFGRAADRY